MIMDSVSWPAWEDPAFYRQDAEVMHRQMQAQQQASPVHWYEAGDLATGVWVLSKWADCRFVGSHPDLFCNRYGHAVGDAHEPTEAVRTQLPEWARTELSKPGVTAARARELIARGKLSMGDPELENMIFLDPPRHGQVRSIFMQSLRPSLVRGHKRRIAEITDEFLDEMIAPGEPVDFVTTIGRVPAAVITELVGVPRSMREEFIRMASAHLQAVTVTPGKDPAEVKRLHDASREFRAYVDELLAERRAGGGDGDDLISVIVRSQLDGGPVPRSLAFVFITHFVAAGETTRILLSHLAMALGQRADQRRMLLDDPQLLANAIEETLRYYPVNWSGCRTATQDVQIRGQTIAKDDYVVMAYAAANRDPEVYADPDRYDINRTLDRDHLGFGHGEHSCPGALLARTEAVTIWERVLARFGDWELAAQPVTWSTPFLRGLTSLPVVFHQ
jgi:cytochrome P450